MKLLDVNGKNVNVEIGYNRLCMGQGRQIPCYRRQ